MESKTVGELIDLAVDTLPKWQRRFVHRRLGRRGRRQEAAEEIAYRFAHDDECCAMIVNNDVFALDGYSALKTPLQFDPANLERILQIILEYLPQILQLFLLFAAVLVFALASFASPSVATAQTVCVDGVCYQLAAPVIRSAPPNLTLTSITIPAAPVVVREVTTVAVRSSAATVYRITQPAARPIWRLGDWFRDLRSMRANRFCPNCGKRK